MSINFEEFRKKLKSLDRPIFRDKAPSNTDYPYYVYSFSSERRIIGSSKTTMYISEYRLSLFTKGTERELIKFKNTFSDQQYEPFIGLLGDENDDTVTNFRTYMDVIESAE